MFIIYRSPKILCALTYLNAIARPTFVSPIRAPTLARDRRHTDCFMLGAEQTTTRVGRILTKSHLQFCAGSNCAITQKDHYALLSSIRLPYPFATC